MLEIYKKNPLIQANILISVIVLCLYSRTQLLLFSVSCGSGSRPFYWQTRSYMKQKLLVTSKEPLRGLNGRVHPPRDKTDTKPVPKVYHKDKKKRVKSQFIPMRRTKTENTQGRVTAFFTLSGSEILSLALCKRTEVWFLRCLSFPRWKTSPTQLHMLRCWVFKTG